MKPELPKLRTEYNFDRDTNSEETGLLCKDPTLAQQHFKDECDINILFARYLETGEIPQIQEGLTYGNFEGIFDFQTAMNAVRTAEGLFSQMPARIKNRFDNDPQKMLEFMARDENREEAEFLGLVTKQEPAHEAGTGSVPQGTPQNTPTGDRTAAGQDKAEAAKKP